MPMSAIALKCIILSIQLIRFTSIKDSISCTSQELATLNYLLFLTSGNIVNYQLMFGEIRMYLLFSESVLYSFDGLKPAHAAVASN